MDPMEVDGTSYGNTPSDVTGDDIGTPFTDLGATTKEAYDAITALWELGVASGISATSYAPDASITRAAMAEFMAGVLDHSNARPAGISIQAETSSGFDGFDSDVVVSYRTDSFAPMVDLSVKTFFTGNDGTADGVGALQEDGTCADATDGSNPCDWSDDETLTDDDGNILVGRWSHQRDEEHLLRMGRR